MPRNMRPAIRTFELNSMKVPSWWNAPAERASRRQDKERLALFSRQLKNADVHFGAQLGKKSRIDRIDGGVA